MHGYTPNLEKNVFPFIIHRTNDCRYCVCAHTDSSSKTMDNFSHVTTMANIKNPTTKHYWTKNEEIAKTKHTDDKTSETHKENKNEQNQAKCHPTQNKIS